MDEEAEARMLANTVQGRTAMAEVHESVQWLSTFVNDHLKAFSTTTMDDVQAVRDHWRTKFDANPDSEKMPGYPLREITAMEKIVRLTKDLVDSIKNDPKIQSIVRAGNLNIHNGFTEEEVWDRLNGVGAHLRCPNCGCKDFTTPDISAAYVKWRSSRRASNVIDAEPAGED